MTRYLASRIGQALLVLWAAFTASFVLLQFLPGDAAVSYTHLTLPTTPYV